MRIKKMLPALVACLALAALTASRAHAALHWTGPLEETLSSETVNVGTDNPSPEAWRLSGNTLGTTVELTAENVECASTCKIEGAGASSATLRFTGVTVMKPANCQAGNPMKTPGTITTNALKDQIKMDTKVGGSTVFFDEFVPATGVGSFFQVEFSGAACTLTEITLPLKGSAEAEVGHTAPAGTFVSAKTGERFSPLLLRFGSAQQETGAGSLALGTGSVVLSGIASMTLSGLRTGQPFGVTE